MGGHARIPLLRGRELGHAVERNDQCFAELRFGPCSHVWPSRPRIRQRRNPPSPHRCSWAVRPSARVHADQYLMRGAGGPFFGGSCPSRRMECALLTVKSPVIRRRVDNGGGTRAARHHAARSLHFEGSAVHHFHSGGVSLPCDDVGDKEERKADDRAHGQGVVFRSGKLCVIDHIAYDIPKTRFRHGSVPNGCDREAPTILEHPRPLFRPGTDPHLQRR